MRKLILCLVAVLYVAISNDLFAQSVQISEKQTPLITYPFSDPDPIPNPGRIYPYARFEGYSDKGVTHNWKMVELENDYIKLWITPEIGGKIWGAVEKVTGKEFIYFNHAVKFRDVAMRGPWTSGGVEFNFGVIGHAPTTSSPVDYMVRTNLDGSVSCFVGAIDFPSRTRWSVEINLAKDKAYFTTRSVWDNPTKEEQSYYHWMNLGIKTAGNLEYSFPGNYFLGHDGKPSSWPVNEKKRKLNFYESNNFEGYKSYHVFGEATGFYGAYWHNDDFGFVHYADYDDKPGKKVWIWGLSDQGMIWEKLLTDTDGQYTEIQSGRLFNQAAGESSLTPFKNREFAPASTDEWTEYWFPVKQTKGLKYAQPEGSVNLQQQGTTFTLGYCPNEKTDGKLEVRNGNTTVFTKEIHSDPMQVTNASFEYSGSYNSLSIWLNNKLFFETNREKHLLKRPVESPSSFNWETAFGHYTKGKEQERQRMYKTAEAEYQKALAVDPWFVSALTGMSHLAYRKTDYRAALDYSLKALSVDTYDAEANMSYGLAGLALRDTTSAIDGFSIASAGISQRSAAFNALSSVFLSRGDYNKALEYADKSLLYNQLGSDAIQLRLHNLRKLGMRVRAENGRSKLEQKDPLNHFIRFEAFQANPSAENKINVQNHITCELPEESYLEYALWYFRNGQFSDALKSLEIAPENHPVVVLWKAYLNHLTGNQPVADAMLKEAIQMNPQFVFPFRIETLKPLEWAKSVSDSWKVDYYTGLIYLNAGADEKGQKLWENCENKPDFSPFYIARSRLLNRGNQKAEADIVKALALAGNDWRTGLFASRYYMEQGNKLKAEELAQSFSAKNPQNYYLGLHYAKMLEMNHKYPACVGLLQKIKVLPNEGATDGRVVWRNANMGNALDFIKSKKYQKALTAIELARQWPSNLGVGKPYLVDERLEDYIALQCYQQLKNELSATEMKEKIAGKAVLQNLSSDANDFLSAWLLKMNGNKLEGDRIMKALNDKNPTSKTVQWCKAIYSGDSEKAKIIVTEDNGNDQTILLFSRVINIEMK
ncbi:MAG: DUF5107 domain-containing protein [Mariniphaga sp.]